MTSQDTARWFAVVAGVALVAGGLLGFVDNPVVGDPRNNPMFVTGAAHNLIHLASGLVALWIAFGLNRPRRANGLIALGVAYAALLLATLFSADVFGLLQYPVNPARPRAAPRPCRGDDRCGLGCANRGADPAAGMREAGRQVSRSPAGHSRTGHSARSNTAVADWRKRCACPATGDNVP